MLKSALVILGVLLFGGITVLLLQGNMGSAEAGEFLQPAQAELLNELFSTHANYFLSDEVIPRAGIPCTAYKVGDRARFGYSNPTEWGYALQAWIAAYERGLVTEARALERISQTVATVLALATNPTQTFNSLPYPFYKVVDSSGNDLSLPLREPDPKIPSGDDALLYASLLIVQGWSIARGYDDLAQAAADATDLMDFRPFLRSKGTRLFLAHTLNADTGELSTSNWDVFADEGGMVAWVAFVSGSISLAEFQQVTDAQHRRRAQWTADSGETFVVQEAAWFNAMFPWSVRSLGGFPIQDADCPAGTSSSFARSSLIPSANAHLALADQLDVAHPAFSDAMSQARGGRGLVGWIRGWAMPPNLAGQTLWNAPPDVTPHALFVPLNALPELSTEERDRWITEIGELMQDEAGYYHSTGDYPFGFEVIASPWADDIEYAGADEGRPVFETLSAAYTLLSLFNALQLDEGGPTFTDFARQVPGYEDKLVEALGFLYP
jgi:hypothetical protein